MGAGREDDAAGADAPDAFPGDVVGGRSAEVVGAALDGEEFLPYSVDLNGAVTLNARVERDAADNLKVMLYFTHEPGAYKVSSYNAAGESGLSAGTLNY